MVDPIEARRVLPTDDHTEVTLEQVRGLLADLATTGKQAPGAPPPLVVLDAGYDASALAHELADEQVQVLVRLNGRRVFYTAPKARTPGQRGAPAPPGASCPCPSPRPARRPSVS